MCLNFCIRGVPTRDQKSLLQLHLKPASANRLSLRLIRHLRPPQCNMCPLLSAQSHAYKHKSMKLLQFVQWLILSQTLEPGEPCIHAQRKGVQVLFNYCCWPTVPRLRHAKRTQVFVNCICIIDQMHSTIILLEKKMYRRIMTLIFVSFCFWGNILSQSTIMHDAQ